MHLTIYLYICVAHVGLSKRGHVDVVLPLSIYLSIYIYLYRQTDR